MTRIFDNIDLPLGPHIKATFGAYDRIDCAVGYFNLRGWNVLASEVDAKPASPAPVARVLVGMMVDDPNSAVLRDLQSSVDGSEPDEISNQLARQRKQEAILKFGQQLAYGLPTGSDLRILRTLKRQLVEGKVTVRLFTRQPLHGKTYITHREDINNPITAFVGSSNFTMRGLKHNYELNVDVVDSDGTEKLDKWFEARWNDMFSIDITADLIDLIEQSWAGEKSVTPYEVFLKVCYHLSKDVREGLVEFSIPPFLREQLLDFQSSAVKTLARRIERRGGVMLGDVVGLGKTITAISVAAVLRDEYGYEPLIVCPKNLVSMWKSYLDSYEIPGKVVSYSQAVKRLPTLRRYRFVIVDESHTLRNNKRKDYIALHEYIRANDSKVLLLTGTPFNISFADVANQIGLYVDEDTDLGLQPTAALAKDSSLMDKVDGKISTLAAFRRSEEEEDWKRLMSDHLIRRTKGFIKENYAQKDEDGREFLTFADGRRYYFPRREPRVITHPFGADDPASRMASDRTLDAIDNLRLPRYGINRYIDPHAPRTPAEQTIIDNFNRSSGHLLGFIRSGMYKRLSSCGHSFLITLQRHIARNNLWLYAIDNNLPLPVGSILNETLRTSDGDLDDAFRADVASDYTALCARNPKDVTWVSPNLFTKELEAHLEEDSKSLQGLIDHYGEWSIEKDSKLQEIHKLLSEVHPDEKVVIFSEFANTADYVGNALQKMGHSRLGVATGDVNDPTLLAIRFAPRSNEKIGGLDVKPEDELRILVSTDVLSEGQNLQDSHIVINYDLPWGLTNLFQRPGRLDRLGQTSDFVVVYSIFHEDVETVLNLRRRIRERLQRNAKVFGSDERFFDSDDETKIVKGLYTGDLNEDELDVDNDASSIAYEIWTKADQTDPARAERVKKLPDLINSTRPTRIGEDISVVVYVRTDGGIDGFGYANKSGDLMLMTGHEALRFFEVEPGTPALVRDDFEFELIKQVVEGPLRRAELKEGRLRGVRSKVWNRLNGHFAAANSEVNTALSALYQRPLTKDAEDRLRRVLATRNDDHLAEMLILLHDDGRLVIKDASGADPIRIVCTLGTSNA